MSNAVAIISSTANTATNPVASDTTSSSTSESTANNSKTVATSNIDQLNSNVTAIKSSTNNSNMQPKPPPPVVTATQQFQSQSSTPVNPSPLSSVNSSPTTASTVSASSVLPTVVTSPPSNLSSSSSTYPPTPNHVQYQPGVTGGSTPSAPTGPSPQPITFSPNLIQQQQFHLFNPNFKDTRWLTLEVCREFQRNKCNRTETDCKFAHPQPHVEIVNGKVIACYDSLKV